MRLVLAGIALAMALVALPARADDNRPLTLAIEPEQASEKVSVTWKVPSNIEAAYLPALTPPENCSLSGRPRNWSDPMGHWREESWNCPGGLAGRVIGIDYDTVNPNLATIARLRSESRTTQTLLLQPGENRLAIPATEEAEGTFAEFLRLGFQHIWEGIDHLLFVTGLIIVARRWRRILITVTGFTIAHSLTLALAALDLVRLPVRAVEAVIALSIVFLAVEILKGPRDSLTWRRPVAVAASFGLLHGFGFASVLREIGLPDQGLLTALFAFNIGIEIGQVLFAGVVFAALQLAARLKLGQGGSLPLPRVAGYGLGIVASYWLLERLSAA